MCLVFAFTLLSLYLHSCFTLYFSKISGSKLSIPALVPVHDDAVMDSGFRCNMIRMSSVSIGYEDEIMHNFAAIRYFRPCHLISMTSKLCIISSSYLPHPDGKWSISEDKVTGKWKQMTPFNHETASFPAWTLNDGETWRQILENEKYDCDELYFWINFGNLYFST